MINDLSGGRLVADPHPCLDISPALVTAAHRSLSPDEIACGVTSLGASADVTGASEPCPICPARFNLWPIRSPAGLKWVNLSVRRRSRNKLRGSAAAEPLKAAGGAALASCDGSRDGSRDGSCWWEPLLGVVNLSESAALGWPSVGRESAKIC